MATTVRRPPDYTVEYVKDLELWFVVKMDTKEVRVVDKSDMTGIRHVLLKHLYAAKANYPKRIGIWSEK